MKAIKDKDTPCTKAYVRAVGQASISVCTGLTSRFLSLTHAFFFGLILITDCRLDYSCGWLKCFNEAKYKDPPIIARMPPIQPKNGISAIAPPTINKTPAAVPTRLSPL